MAPIIGLVASIQVVEGGASPGSERQFAGSGYLGAVARAGGIPVILPVIADPAVIDRHLAVVDGLLLLGGDDVDPARYGTEPAVRLGDVFPARDEYEIAALRAASRAGKPVLGVCRGLQVINVAFGGTLYQDLPSEWPGPGLQHRQASRGDVPGHTVEIVRATVLQEILGATELRTNSFHHQAVKTPAAGLTVNARAGDGVIEGLERREADILAVQWHPELMYAKYPAMLELFRWLVDRARARSRVTEKG